MRINLAMCPMVRFGWMHLVRSIAITA